MFKNVIENLDKLEVGKKCQLLSNSKWWGANTTEPNIWLCGKIANISWGKNDCFKTEYGVPAITINVRASHKYGTPNSSITCLPHHLIKNEILKIEIK